MSEGVLDALDRQIAGALQLNGRAAWRDIALAVDSTETTVARRAQRLIDSGMVRVAMSRTPACIGMAQVATVYIRCEPGKGHCMHRHPAVEVFIPMSGLWEIEIVGVGKITAEPWDVVSMPGGTFHAATNISDEPAYMMSVNNGTKTAAYTIAPEIIAEIGRVRRAAGEVQ